MYIYTPRINLNFSTNENRKKKDEKGARKLNVHSALTFELSGGPARADSERPCWTTRDVRSNEGFSGREGGAGHRSVLHPLAPTTRDFCSSLRSVLGVSASTPPVLCVRAACASHTSSFSSVYEHSIFMLGIPVLTKRALYAVGTWS